MIAAYNGGMKELIALDQIQNLLNKNQISFVIGGSGLLYFLGLQKSLGDWDIITDESVDKVESALQDLEYIKFGPNSPFASEYMFKLKINDIEIDIIGKFALEYENSIIHIPAKIGFWHNQYPIADVKDWIQVYSILNREHKNDGLKTAMLKNWQSKNLQLS